MVSQVVHSFTLGPDSRVQGANTALRDTALLRHTRVEVETLGVRLVQAKVQYETTMLR